MEQQQPVRRRYLGKQRPRPSEFVPVSPPLAAEPHQPKRKRTQTGTRVQLAGQRASCSESWRGALQARLQQARASRETWTGLEWERVVQQLAKEAWGAVNHGGYRCGVKRVRRRQQAVSDQGQVGHGSIIIVGEAKSAVGQIETSATGNEHREEGHVARSFSRWRRACTRSRQRLSHGRVWDPSCRAASLVRRAHDIEHTKVSWVHGA